VTQIGTWSRYPVRGPLGVDDNQCIGWQGHVRWHGPVVCPSRIPRSHFPRVRASRRQLSRSQKALRSRARGRKRAFRSRTSALAAVQRGSPGTGGSQLSRRVHVEETPTATWVCEELLERYATAPGLAHLIPPAGCATPFSDLAEEAGDRRRADPALHWSRQATIARDLFAAGDR
jgi:hypothetical protein